jgi:hypothetical protein
LKFYYGATICLYSNRETNNYRNGKPHQVMNNLSMKGAVYFLLLFLVISCGKTPPSNEMHEPDFEQSILGFLKSDMEAVTVGLDTPAFIKNLRLLPNDNLSFYYQTGDSISREDTITDGTLEVGDSIRRHRTIDLACRLVNNSDRDVYYLTKSCHGLEELIFYSPSSFYDMPYFQCNISYPRIERLAKHDTLRIETFLEQGQLEYPLEQISIVVFQFDTLVSLGTMNAHYEWVYKFCGKTATEANIIAGQEIDLPGHDTFYFHKHMRERYKSLDFPNSVIMLVE